MRAGPKRVRDCDTVRDAVLEDTTAGVEDRRNKIVSTGTTIVLNYVVYGRLVPTRFSEP